VEGRDVAENEALEKVIEYCRSNYRDFDYTTSKSEFNLGLGGGLDLTLSLFMASRVYTALGGGIDIVFTGHMAIRTWEVVEGAAVFSACFVNKKFKPEWLRPLTGLRKVDTYESIPQELADMTWSCRRPLYVEDTYRPCGKCHACQTLAKAVAQSRARSGPARDQASRGKAKRFVISAAGSKTSAGG
jgi:hypothetical protein